MKKIIIDSFSAWLLGAELWGQIQGIVNIVEDPGKSGAYKRAAALDALKRVGISAAGFLLNLGLELAVAKLKIGQGK